MAKTQRKRTRSDAVKPTASAKIAGKKKQQKGALKFHSNQLREGLDSQLRALSTKEALYGIVSNAPDTVEESKPPQVSEEALAAITEGMRDAL